MRTGRGTSRCENRAPGALVSPSTSGCGRRSPTGPSDRSPTVWKSSRVSNRSGTSTAARSWTRRTTNFRQRRRRCTWSSSRIGLRPTAGCNVLRDQARGGVARDRPAGQADAVGTSPARGGRRRLAGVATGLALVLVGVSTSSERRSPAEGSAVGVAAGAWPSGDGCSRRARPRCGRRASAPGESGGEGGIRTRGGL